jgi:hypothetical protein
MELLNDDSLFILVAAFNAFTTQNVPIIFHTGASLSITPEKADFIKPPAAPQKMNKLVGMAGNMEIKGMGTVSWTSLSFDGSVIKIRTLAHSVPNANAR